MMNCTHGWSTDPSGNPPCPYCRIAELEAERDGLQSELDRISDDFDLCDCCGCLSESTDDTDAEGNSLGHVQCSGCSRIAELSDDRDALKRELDSEQVAHLMTRDNFTTFADSMIAERDRWRERYQDASSHQIAAVVSRDALKRECEGLRTLERSCSAVVALEEHLKDHPDEVAIRVNLAAVKKRLRKALSALSPAEPKEPELPQGCHRSHPHEDMDAGCKRLTEIARQSAEPKENGADSARDAGAGR